VSAPRRTHGASSDSASAIQLFSGHGCSQFLKPGEEQLEKSGDFVCLAVTHDQVESLALHPPADGLTTDNGSRFFA